MTIRLQHRHGRRHRGQPGPRPPRCCAPASGSSARCRGPTTSAGRPTSTTRRRARRHHGRASGATGSTGPASPTTAGGTRSSGRRWRSRASPTCRPARPSPRSTTSLPETPGGERNWDYRYTWMRDSTFTLQALHWLNLDWEADEFMQFVADLEPNDDGALQIMYGIDGRRDLTEIDVGPPERVRRRPPGAGRQRRLRPAPERRLRRRPRLDPPAHPAQPAPPPPAVADRPVPGRVRDGRVARAGPGHLGGARQAAALRVVEADVLGRARPGGEAGRHPRRRRPPRRRGGRPPTRSAPTSSSTASATEACSASTTTPTRWTLPRSSPRCSASCAGDDERRPQQRARHRRRADRERLRAPLPHRRDRRRAVRQGGHVPHLLVLARLALVHRRRGAFGPAT